MVKKAQQAGCGTSASGGAGCCQVEAVVSDQGKGRNPGRG
jgi:hypothetical protein